MKELYDFLDSRGAVYTKISHEPTFNSKESAKARGEEISIGGKAIVMKIDGKFLMFILSASKKIDSSSLRKIFDAKRIRFATEKELFGLTELEPNCVPPFGRPLIDVDLFVDNSVFENPKIAFNAASRTNSVIMDIEQYKKIVGSRIFYFSK
ncbi:hypothetical protein JXA84_08000 [candidate division WOR-3 bacterium]|nr:hypothetical protein [candidate division WOR-3 bacterium]